jgi:hypothetical protein
LSGFSNCSLRFFTSNVLPQNNNLNRETSLPKFDEVDSVLSSSLKKEEKFVQETYKQLSAAKEVDPSEIARITKHLNEICDVKMLESETPEKIAELWKQYHTKKYCVYSSIPSKTYTSLNVRLQQNPMFILPRIISPILSIVTTKFHLELNSLTVFFVLFFCETDAQQQYPENKELNLYLCKFREMLFFSHFCKSTRKKGFTQSLYSSSNTTPNSCIPKRSPIQIRSLHSMIIFKKFKQNSITEQIYVNKEY